MRERRVTDYVSNTVQGLDRRYSPQCIQPVLCVGSISNERYLMTPSYHPPL